MSDRLTSLLHRFELSAHVIHAGVMRDRARFDDTLRAAHLHLLRRGRLAITVARGKRAAIDEPGLLLFPHGSAHQLEATDARGAELVCASVAFGMRDENPLLRALPAMLSVPLAGLPGLAATHQLLFDEAFGKRCGHAAVVNRLTEVLVVQVLRHAIENHLVDGGLLAGLADPRLHKALCAVHANPAATWSLATMATAAGMSRARFAAHFVHQVGMPPGEYLTRWRLGLARSMLRRGLPMKHVAAEVGYASASALGRVFTHHMGMSPKAWRQAGAAQSPAAVRATIVGPRAARRATP